MQHKKNVLIVTNAITTDELSQIKASVKKNGVIKDIVKLSLVHVIATPPSGYFNFPCMNLLIEKYYDEAKESLIYVGKQLSIPKKDQWLISGKIRTEVLRLAGKLSASFILASAQQIQELQRSLFFKNIHQKCVN